MKTIQGAIKSLTIWFNGVIAVLLGVLHAMPDLLLELGNALPQLQGYISADLYKYLMVLVIVGNILLRFKTSQSLADKAGNPQ